jgi:excisionase family DNA binding protein
MQNKSEDKKMLDVLNLPRKALLTPDEVAQFFGVSTKTIYIWVELGKLSACNPSGGCLRIYRESVIQLMDKTRKE